MNQLQKQQNLQKVESREVQNSEFTVIKEIFTEDKTFKFQLCYDEALYNKYFIVGYFCMSSIGLKSRAILYWYGPTEEAGLYLLDEFKARREELHNYGK